MLSRPTIQCIISKSMQVKYHAALGGIASLALVPVFGVNSSVFFASTVLIDSDHYLDYIWRNRFTDFSVKRMFAYHRILLPMTKELNFLGLSIMHTVEFMLLMCAVAAFTSSPFVLAILGGILLHMALDLSYLCRRGMLFSRALSIFEYVIRWNRMKRQGICPRLPYRLALAATLENGKLPRCKEHDAAEEDREVAPKKYPNHLR